MEVFIVLALAFVVVMIAINCNVKTLFTFATVLGVVLLSLK